MIEIRRCTLDELDALMGFLDRHWRAGHVLANSRELMMWQHGNTDGLNYLGAWRGGELIGVLGYIPTRRFDPALLGDNLLWLALWKVRDDARVGGLGLKLMNALVGFKPNVGMGVNGINPAHQPMYRALRWQVGVLRQFFAVDPASTQKLIKNPKGLPLPKLASGDARLIPMSARDLTHDGYTTAIPRKSPRYFIKRFLDHSFYDYRVHRLEASGCGPALIATRVAEHAGSRVLRIVDFLGDVGALAAAGGALLELLRSTEAEHVDFYQFGLPEEELARAGFGPVDKNGSVFVPTYFEPYATRAGDILFAVKSKQRGPVVICRADGDQDRPNQVPVAS